MAYHTFQVAGETWTSDDYTLAEMVAMEGRTRVKWWSMDLANEAEAQRAAIEAWYRRTAPDDDDAAKRAGALTAGQIRVTRVDGDSLPETFTNGIPTPDPKETTTGSA
jgi:hypothetical protein